MLGIPFNPLFKFVSGHHNKPAIPAKSHLSYPLFYVNSVCSTDFYYKGSSKFKVNDFYKYFIKTIKTLYSTIEPSLLFVRIMIRLCHKKKPTLLLTPSILIKLKFPINIFSDKFSAWHLKVILVLLFVLYVAVHVNISAQSIDQEIIHLKQDASLIFRPEWIYLLEY